MFLLGPCVGDFPIQAGRLLGGGLGLGDLPGQGVRLGGQRGNALAA